MLPNDRKYAKTHEWILVDGETAMVGITDFAQHEMGDIVFVELPERTNTYTQGEPVAVVESVKAVSDIYAPVSGEIVGVNDVLEDVPQTLNQSPFDTALFEIKPSDLSELDALMTAEEYEAHIAEEQA